MIRSEGTLEEQELYDKYYIHNWSIWMDVWILAKTVITLLLPRGAY